LIAVAVSNRHFRQLLLTDPGKALATGYRGETFALSEEERSWVLAVRASSLQEFAQQLTLQQSNTVKSNAVKCNSATGRDQLSYIPNYIFRESRTLHERTA
jgi:hypothetical protein